MLHLICCIKSVASRFRGIPELIAKCNLRNLQVEADLKTEGFRLKFSRKDR